MKYPLFFSLLILSLTAQAAETAKPAKHRRFTGKKIKAFYKAEKELGAETSAPFTAEQESKEVLILDELLGLELIGLEKFAEANLNLKAFTPKPGISLKDLRHPEEHASLINALKPFLGKPVTNHTLIEIKKAILKNYTFHDHPAITAFIPKQSLAAKVLQVHVIEGRVGKLSFVGQKHFKEEDISQWSTLQPGDTIDIDGLIDDLWIMNINPFRQTNAVFSPGEGLGETDIEFNTVDRRLYRPYIGADNTGFPETGYNRFYYGVQIGKLFKLDHQLDYQYTMNTDHNKFQAHVVKYVAPLPWCHILSFVGGHSAAHITQSGIAGNTKATNSQLTARYQIPLDSIPNYLHEINVGFDYKRTNNTLTGSGFHEGQTVNLTQLMLGYNGGWEGKKRKVSLTLEFFASPFTWLPHQAKTNIESIRPNATLQYGYARAFVSFLQRLPKDFEVQLKFRGQASTGILLPTEEFGAGGYDSVRGYLERELNGDNAVIINGEFRSPTTHLMKRIWNKAFDDSFQARVFLDYAFVGNRKPQSFELKKAHIVSIGPGFSYNVAQNLDFRFDWGFQLRKTGLNHRFHQRAHFGLTASY